MVEADLFCLLGLFYSSLVCLVSMSMYWWLELKPGWEWLADVVAVTWIGLSMSGVAWMKAWMVRRKATLRTVVPSNVNGRTTDRSTLVSSLTTSAFHIYQISCFIPSLQHDCNYHICRVSVESPITLPL